ncbi:hypothetical protein X551_04758 [Methylibium sp. T29]|nr:hypothetical protein X551_04758 [Methylibium sp. T29]EWS57212.1 hypothetical protein Y694_04722 [Methylibium sp. T29-B]
MGVLGEVEGVVSTAERALEVAQEGVDRLELRQLGAGLAAAGDHALVLGPDDLHGAEAPQAVGDDGGRGRDRACGEHRHLLVRERLLAQAHELRLAVGRGLHRGDERHLVLRASPGLAARALAAQVGVVNLHSALELAGVLAHAHDLHELVLDQPGGLVANAQVAHQLERGDVVLGLGQQVHGQEPARQPQLGGLEDRPADDAALVAARGALKVQPALAPKRAVLAATACRTGKARRPPRGDRRRLALLLAAVAVHEFGHRKSSLKLHSVHRHGSPPVAVNPSSTLGSSPREPAEVRR